MLTLKHVLLCTKCLRFLPSSLFLSRLKALYLNCAMLAFTFPAMSRHFCNSLCPAVKFENGNKSTLVPRHKHFPYSLQKPGQKSEKISKAMIDIEQLVKATLTEQLEANPSHPLNENK